jgi:hypothetical protein
LDVAQALRDQGYDVLRASETGDARADDQQILQKAISENRILTTLDEHFGDWVTWSLSVISSVFPVTPEADGLPSSICPFLALYNQQPGTSNQQPETSNQELATSNQQLLFQSAIRNRMVFPFLALYNQQPATSNQQPGTSNQKRATSNFYFNPQSEIRNLQCITYA